MSFFKNMESKLFFRYNEADVFDRSFAKFLFYLYVVFIFLMGVLFFINLRKLGFIVSFATSGTSWISALICMVLIVKGKARMAGAVLSIFQTCIIILGCLMRLPELNLVTVLLFAFPTILLATVFAYRWIHISVVVVIIAVIIINCSRFDISTVITSPEIVKDMVVRGTVIFITTILIFYSVAIATLRSMKLSLKMTREEAEKSNEKNRYILELINTIRKSYNELTGAMDITDQAVSNIFLNMQTEASTIEELVAAIEEVSSSTSSVEQATKDQNQSVNNLSESIDGLSRLIDSLQLFGSDLQKEFSAIAKVTLEGRSSSGELNEVNRKTLANSENIQGIAGIIDDIFDRINLLSLNASIEAARAGEHGRGFAVVADEIGKLADNSSSELKKIKDLIDANRSDVEFSNSIIAKITEFIETLGETLNNVQSKAVDTMKIISGQKELQGDMILRNKSVHEKSEFIKLASSEQSIAIQEISKSIENTNGLVQENTRNAESLKESYDRLRKTAGELKLIMDEKS